MSKEKRIAYLAIRKFVDNREDAKAETDWLFEQYPDTQPAYSAPASRSAERDETPRQQWCTKSHTSFVSNKGPSAGKTLFPLDCPSCRQHKYVQSLDKTTCSPCRTAQRENGGQAPMVETPRPDIADIPF